MEVQVPLAPNGASWVEAHMIFGPVNEAHQASHGGPVLPRQCRRLARLWDSLEVVVLVTEWPLLEGAVAPRRAQFGSGRSPSSCHRRSERSILEVRESGGRDKLT